MLANAQMTVAAAPGLGTVTLGAAAPGAQTWAAAGAVNATAYSYRIEEGQAWEIGTGTYTASGTTLTRTTILASSAGGTTAVSFGAGAIVSQIALPVDVQPYVSAPSASAATGAATISSAVDQVMTSVSFTALRSVHAIFATGAVANAGAAVEINWALRVFDTTSGTAQVAAIAFSSTAYANALNTGVLATSLIAGLTYGRTYQIQITAVKSADNAAAVTAKNLQITGVGFA
ncbi:hypothetical protein [Methylobacterium sp. WL6]|uniref:hypothetical protein n=1 Tax=Methylobacterium sp. WL6 TaxID=2603901 RepID=UPI0011C762CC|nr:hypothetical protein [Methylobacterium sp. WL6]TXN67269.1 hypothetical protein FV230_14500 [Methylobacterium sp. WL6]